MSLPKAHNMSYFQKENFLFFGFNVVFFSCSALYFGFLVMFLTSKGYSSFECGIVNMLISVCSLLFQPVAGYLTDTFITIKKYLIISSIGAMLATFLLPLTASIPILMAVSVMILSLCATPVSFLGDTWAVTLREERPHIDYGKNRAGGSIGYSIASVSAGFLIAPLGYNILFIIHVILFGVLILIISQIPSVPCRNAKTKSTEKTHSLSSNVSFAQALKILVKEPRYVIFLASAICYYIALKAFSANVPYKVIDLGGADSDMGIVLAIGAIFEVPILFIINYCIRRFKLNYLYLISCTFILLRGITLASAGSMSVLLISQAFQAFSYGIFLAASLEIVSAVVPNHIRATSITLMVGMTNGLGAIVGTLVAGILVDEIGVNAMAFIMSAFALSGLIIYTVHTFSKQRKEKDNAS